MPPTSSSRVQCTPSLRRGIATLSPHFPYLNGMPPRTKICKMLRVVKNRTFKCTGCAGFAIFYAILRSQGGWTWELCETPATPPGNQMNDTARLTVSLKKAYAYTSGMASLAGGAGAGAGAVVQGDGVLVVTAVSKAHKIPSRGLRVSEWRLYTCQQSRVEMCFAPKHRRLLGEKHGSNPNLQSCV